MNHTPFITDSETSAGWGKPIETGTCVSERFLEPIQFDTGPSYVPEIRIQAGLRIWGDEERTMFEQLANEWAKTRSRGADLDGMIMNPAYQRIIGMGKPAIPYLLEKLTERPDHWFWALFAISGDNPVRPEHEGKLSSMAESWIAWGRDRGYLA